ncbi:hypothetical protein CKK33_11450 [Mucilaginibacter sp. MD40]|uniref:hypothetical protein n=1 Tax=Mucilaginibacter sp. MD40 TaxID=2029590 RepID=UPI000BACC0CF|nr:hypothetical protein [Mucilaginibacter sp. MD40]PAW94076.1 hypothetical protein CKK33_11450 [Mucilaginibacter sp. MD40]
MPKEYKPFRVRFTKANTVDQLKAVKKLLNRHPSLTQIVNELTSVDPVITVYQNGSVNFLTDAHLFKT